MSARCPTTFTSKRAFTVLDTEFSGGLTEPVQIMVGGKADDPGAAGRGAAAVVAHR
jgi:hypothetical protein